MRFIFYRSLTLGSLYLDVQPLHESNDLDPGSMSLLGEKMISGESFVVEGSASDCQESDLKRLLCHCTGGLQLRQLTAEDQSDLAKEDLSEEENGHQNDMADKLALLLRDLLTELFS